MKKLLFLLCILVAGLLFADEQPRWSKVANQSATAATYTSKWDSDNDGDDSGETRAYSVWRVYNGDTADTVYCDANSHSTTQNTAVNDGTRSTSIPIVAGGTYTFEFSRGNARSTMSCICASGQTCSNLTIYTSDRIVQ